MKDPKEMGLGEIVREIVSVAETETLLRVYQYVPNMVHVPLLHQGLKERKIRQQRLYDELTRRDEEYAKKDHQYLLP